MERKRHLVFLAAVVLAAVASGTGCDKLKARDRLNKGVQAYKNGQFDVAIDHFKEAKALDPTLTNAQLYLAAAYNSLYIPGAPSPENVRNGEQAIAEYKSILDQNPQNVQAIDGLGSVLYNMAGTPFDTNKLAESKNYHQKHIEISPNDAEPYYWVGVIDWALAFHGNRELRDDYNKKSKKPIKENDPMPPPLATQFSQKYGSTIEEGVTNLQKAMTLRADYDDAMAYLNLLYRQKADTETNLQARNADLQQADDLVEKVKAIKQKKSSAATPSS